MRCPADILFLIGPVVGAIGLGAEQHEAGEAALVEHRRRHLAGEAAVGARQLDRPALSPHQRESAVVVGIAAVRASKSSGFKAEITNIGAKE